MTHKKATMPSQVSDRVGRFDRLADKASQLTSKAWFFTFCVLLVLVWAPSIVLIRSVNTWQLIINTVTTIVTFLLVALLQNGQSRSDMAIQHKLNGIADALGDLTDDLARRRDESSLRSDGEELRTAVGLEKKESTSHNVRPTV